MLEKYPDFFRDFRGDTVHPSTLELLYELGWLDDFSRSRTTSFNRERKHRGRDRQNRRSCRILPTHCKFVALMPQWDFLNFLAERGRRYPTFHLMMKTEGDGLIEERQAALPACAPRTRSGEIEIAAKLVVGADGRHSTIRESRRLRRRRSRRADGHLVDAHSQASGDSTHSSAGCEPVTLWSCSTAAITGSARISLPKVRSKHLQAEGIGALQRGIARDRADAERPRRRARRLVEDRDAGRTRRPARALASARTALHRRCSARDVADRRHRHQSRDSRRGRRPRIFSADPLRAGATPSETDLQRIQDRRMFPTKVTQAFQTFVQDRAIGPLMQGARLRHRPCLLVYSTSFPFCAVFPRA